MTDRDIDLIRAAGKAAGLTLQLALGFTPEDRELFTPDGRRFNPLTDDGDALRLAVALRIDVAHHGAATIQARSGDGPISTEYVNLGADPYAATRRAIVRAAAAMAKADA